MNTFSNLLNRISALDETLRQDELQVIDFNQLVELNIRHQSHNTL